MIKQGKGVIINLASISGFRGGRSGFAYTVAKHGVIGLTKAVAVEYGAAGIRCRLHLAGLGRDQPRRAWTACPKKD